MAQIEADTHPLRSTPLHVAVAVLAMGGWAGFANRAHGAPAPAIAFAVQGALSGGLMLGLKRWLEWMDGRVVGSAGWLVAPLISSLAIAALLTAAHALAGTPEVAPTIALPWTVSTSYAFLYSFSLDRPR